MDWDWEDRPPSGTPPPRRAADEPGPAADSRTPEPEPPTRPERPAPERPEPEPLDESVTQVFSADAAWDLTREPAPVESAPPAPAREYVLPDRTETGRPAVPSGAEFERPSLRTIEVAERAAVGGDRRPDDRERRPRSPQERAARRAQRRRQLRRRRLVALAILIVIVILIVVLVARGCGGSGAGTSALVFGMILIDRRLLAGPGRR